MDMTALAFLLLAVGHIDVVRSDDFPEGLQTSAVTATVRVVNAAKGGNGTGVVIGRGGPFVYVLTAGHVVDGARALEVHTFSADAYPRAAKVYRAAEVVARERRADLALIRVSTRDAPPGL